MYEKRVNKAHPTTKYTRVCTINRSKASKCTEWYLRCTEVCKCGTTEASLKVGWNVVGSR
jgi:hypothetical protein